jgi:hypothetical protein
MVPQLAISDQEPLATPPTSVVDPGAPSATLPLRKVTCVQTRSVRSGLLEVEGAHAVEVDDDAARAHRAATGIRERVGIQASKSGH